MKTIYLAGPINGCTDEECKDWRNYVASRLPNYTTLDPMRRDYRGVEDLHTEDIVRGDLEDIDRSDILIVNAPKPSWGTAMEVFYAFREGKHICMVVPKDTLISPWQRYHSHYICHSFDDAVEWITE